jgi:type II secretory pathway component GspD/PulD (secretin)
MPVPGRAAAKRGAIRSREEPDGGKEAKVARASKWSGLGIALGMSGWLSGGAQAATLSALLGMGDMVAQAPVRPSQIHNALSNAIKSYQQGDFETAATYLKLAQAGQDDLSASERQELASLIRDNGVALTRRRQGAEQLERAQAAMSGGRTREAEELLRAVQPNQYLSNADRTKLRDLEEQLRSGVRRASNSTYPQSSASPSVLAHTKLQQARLLLNGGNYDAAESLAHEAEQLHVSYGPNEDTPRKVLDDILIIKGDTKAIVSAGRRALQEGDLDRAEGLARSAQHASGGWGVRLFGDSPAKLLKDIDNARSRAMRDPHNLPVPNGTEIAPSRAARMLLEQGRQALQQGNLEQASEYASQADGMHGEFHWWEDNPGKLKADIQRQWERSKRHGNAPDGKPDGSSRLITNSPAVAVDTDKKKRREAEAAQLLADARDLFRRGKYDLARAKASRAEQVHGPYSVWEINDRPSKLIDQIDAAQTAQAKSKGGAGQMTTASSAALPTLPAVPALTQPVGGPPAAGPSSPIVLASAQAAGAVQSPSKLPSVPDGAVPDAGKQRATILMREAKSLSQQGRLLEARQKMLEAQALHVRFGPEEETPERMLLACASLANRRAELLVQRAADYAATAQTDSTRWQKAEESLEEARQLAQAYSLDSQAIERNAAWVRRARTNADTAQSRSAQTPAMSPPVPTSGAAMPAPTMSPPVPTAVAADSSMTAASAGQEMLQKARIELSRGELETARRLAVEVYNGPYQIRGAAEAVLHSIDAEEYAQRSLQAGRSFDAGMEAYGRRDYAQSSTILHSLDPSLLNKDQQAKLKEMMLMPELATRAVAQAAAHATGQTAPEPGRITVSDAGPTTPENTYAKQFQAMQEIEFQRLRDQGLRAMREAIERFKAGDAQQAMDILTQYLDGLKENSMEPERLVLLKRPVEARLQQFRAMRSQKEYEKLKNGERDAFNKMMTHEALVEEHKEKQIAELMKQYHELYKDGKYREAEVVAKRAHELAPDDARIAAAIQIADTHGNQVDYTNLKGRKEDVFLKGQNDAEDPGPVVTTREPIAFDNERWATVKNRNAPPREGYQFTVKTEKEKEIEHKLLDPVTFDFKDTPIKEIIDDLRDWTQLNIVIDQPALDDEAISLSRPLSIKLDNVMAKTALDMVLHQAHLIYVIQGEVVLITTEAHSRGKLVQTTYQVADLVIPIDNQTLPNSTNMDGFMQAGAYQRTGVGSTPVTGPGRLPIGTPTGSPAGSMPMPQITSSTAGRAPGQTLEDVLMKLITSTIKPETWSEMGGPGTIEYYPLGMALIVSQSPDIQEQIAELLEALRRLQDVEMTIEIRFISLEEDFFERMGVDFAMNILTDNAKFAPIIQANRGTPFGFQPKSFVSGITAPINGGLLPDAIPFTPDLNIPISSTSFGASNPPFGSGGSIGTDGGLSLGLAFLSDIQVFLFLDAAEGDSRSNVMTAPKITLFNGQTSTITVATTQYFVTNITAIETGAGSVLFIPQNSAFNTGMTMTVNGVVSADRRFVRMSLAPNLNNIAGSELFPITTFITPTVLNGLPGEPVPFTQFLQSPTIDNISVNTTVNVPDGGTVVMGGLKLMNEQRNELGPPILSKIPFINRLFKNVGYGRLTRNLMIMVTPRVVIQAEEETRQTGVGQALGVTGIAPQPGGLPQQ